MSENWRQEAIPEQNWRQQAIPDQPPESRTKSESVWNKIRQSRGETGLSVGGQIGEGLSSVGRKIVAEPIAGYAGIAGTIAGLWPGGESPSEKGAKWVEGTREFIGGGPSESALGQSIEGGVASTAETVSDVGRNAIAPVVTQHNLLGPEYQQQVREQIKEEGLSKTLGDKTMERTGSPLLATVVETGPTAMALAAGTKFKKPEVPRPSVTPPRVTPSGQPVSVGRPTLDSPVDITPPKIPSAEEIVSHIKKNKPANVAESVLPDKQIIESAQRLGVDLNPEHYSTNAAFQDVARSLKTRPGSQLEAIERKALDDLAVRADELVQKIGGSLDKAAVSDDIVLSVRNTITELEGKADKAYTAVRKSIPLQTRVDPTPIIEYLDTKLLELGGDIKLLSSSEKKLFNLTKKQTGPNTWTSKSPTYGALDRVRRDIGNGFKNRGAFKDDDSAILSQTYGVLSDVQSGVADSFGVGALYNSGRLLVSERKAIEEAATVLFGKNLSGSIVPQMRSAAAGLKVGGLDKFRKLMSALPEKRRAEVAATILGDVFSAGSRQGGGLSQGFTSTFAAINRSPTVKKELFSYLPAGAEQRFNDIGRVLTGIVKANQKPLANPSGSAGPIVKALEDGSGIAKIYAVGKSIAKAEGASTAIGVPGIGTAVTVGALMNKAKTPVLVAADEMLASPAFARAVNKAAQGQAEQAARILQSNGQYQKWLRLQDAQTQRNIAAVGFISWLTEEQQ
jgi:hypothetical protein